MMFLPKTDIIRSKNKIFHEVPTMDGLQRQNHGDNLWFISLTEVKTTSSSLEATRFNLYTHAWVFIPGDRQ